MAIKEITRDCNRIFFHTDKGKTVQIPTRPESVYGMDPILSDIFYNLMTDLFDGIAGTLWKRTLLLQCCEIAGHYVWADKGDDFDPSEEPLYRFTTTAPFDEYSEWNNVNLNLLRSLLRSCWQIQAKPHAYKALIDNDAVWVYKSTLNWALNQIEGAGEDFDVKTMLPWTSTVRARASAGNKRTALRKVHRVLIRKEQELLLLDALAIYDWSRQVHGIDVSQSVEVDEVLDEYMPRGPWPIPPDRLRWNPFFFPEKSDPYALGFSDEKRVAY